MSADDTDRHVSPDRHEERTDPEDGQPRDGDADADADGNEAPAPRPATPSEIARQVQERELASGEENPG